MKIHVFGVEPREVADFIRELVGAGCAGDVLVTVDQRGTALVGELSEEDARILADDSVSERVRRAIAHEVALDLVMAAARDCRGGVCD